MTFQVWTSRRRLDPRDPAWWEFCNMFYGADNSIFVRLAQMPGISVLPHYWLREETR